jgi:predicted nucleic acid-binding protein
MTGKTFIDSNVAVYAADESPAERSKHEIAAQVLAQAPSTLVVSTQVLHEFYVTVTRKLAVPLSLERAARAVRGLAKLDVVAIDAELTLAAVDTARTVQLSLWDALIIEAACRGGCERVLTEDLSDGQVIRGVRIENPFRDCKPAAR